MIVVTGAAGFIGSNLVADLEAAGEGPIVGVDTLGVGEKWQNIANRNLLDLVIPERLPAFLERYASDIRVVFHLGAKSKTTETDADLVLERNIRCSIDLWDWCARTRVPFIYASSAATYGNGAYGFVDDEMPEALAKLRPLNLYAWSKHVVDRRNAMLTSKNLSHPPQWAGIKFFNVYGPNEHHKGEMRSVVHKLYFEITAGKPVCLFKSYRDDIPDGEQKRDFVYVRDCTKLMIWLMRNSQVSGIFNMGSGQARSFLDVSKAIAGVLGLSPKIEFIDAPIEIRSRYQYFTQASTMKLRRTGYRESPTSLEAGVSEYVRDFLEPRRAY